MLDLKQPHLPRLFDYFGIHIRRHLVNSQIRDRRHAPKMVECVADGCSWIRRPTRWRAQRKNNGLEVRDCE
jgi:hypothetical protein